MKTLRAPALVFAFANLGECAETLPPQDLVTARATYARVSGGPTAALDPADLHTAKETLDLAETSFTRDGDTQQTRDFAYTAHRRALLAGAKGAAIAADQQQQQTLRDM